MTSSAIARFAPSGSSALLRALDFDYDGLAARYVTADYTAVLAQYLGSAQTLGRAKQLGLRTVLNVSTSHPREFNYRVGLLWDRYPEHRAGLAEYLYSEEVLSMGDVELDSADVAQVLSQAAADSLAGHGVERDRILVNPIGVDLRAFSPDLRSRRPGALRLLFVGRVSALKGIPDVVEALRSIKLPCEFTIVGQVDPTTAKWLSGSGYCRLLGQLPRDRVAEEMRRSDALILPSHIEGFGAVGIQSLACGRPVALSEAVPIADEVAESRVGWKFPPGDIEAIAATLLDAYDRRDELQGGSQSRVDFAHRYTWQRHWAALRPFLLDDSAVALPPDGSA